MSKLKYILCLWLLLLPGAYALAQSNTAACTADLKEAYHKLFTSLQGQQGVRFQFKLFSDKEGAEKDTYTYIYRKGRTYYNNPLVEAYQDSAFLLIIYKEQKLAYLSRLTSKDKGDRFQRDLLRSLQMFDSLGIASCKQQEGGLVQLHLNATSYPGFSNVAFKLNKNSKSLQEISWDQQADGSRWFMQFVSLQAPYSQLPFTQSIEQIAAKLKKEQPSIQLVDLRKQ